MAKPDGLDNFRPRPRWSSWQTSPVVGETASSSRHPASRPLTAVAVLVLAALAALVVVSLLPGRDSAAAPSTLSGANPALPVGSDGAGSASLDPPSGPEAELRASPALRIHPQRAAAGSPLELQVSGMGCPGRSGVLSITEVGSAAQSGGPDRLVVRRRFDVAADLTFRATPLLVDQPPGSYRVAIACARYRMAEAPDGDRARDVFELTEVLELTGPAAAREFRVSPPAAAPGLATSFNFAGEGCSGEDARVEVRVFPPSAMTAGTLAVVKPALDGGSWSGTYTVAALGAVGTYTFEASCSDRSGLQFSYVNRHVHFGELVFQAPPLPGPSWFSGLSDLPGFTALDDLADLLRPPNPKPEPAAAQSVEGSPPTGG